MKIPKRLAQLRRSKRSSQPKGSAAQGRTRLQQEVRRNAPQEPASALSYPVVVYTKEELADATRRKERRIVVKGELAAKISASFKGLRNLSASSLNTLALVLSGAALFAPFTGGVSLGAAGTVMGTVGAALTASAIAAISAIGVALIVAVFKGYDEIKLSGGGIELVLRSGTKHTNNDQGESAEQDEPADQGEPAVQDNAAAQDAPRAQCTAHRAAVDQDVPRAQRTAHGEPTVQAAP